jgi:hypothetical protein
VLPAPAGQQHHLRPPPGHHRPAVTARDPHQPAALIISNLAHPQAFTGPVSAISTRGKSVL